MDKSEILNKLQNLNKNIFVASQLLNKNNKSDNVRKFDITKELPDCERIVSDLGEFIKLTTKTPLSEIGNFPQNISKILSIITYEKEFEGINLHDLLFIDTETTGLAGGTGTFPFLTGIGYFENENFVVEQYLMEDYQHELAMMSEISKRFKNYKAFVSYNGKSFDIPLLQNRFISNRLPINFSKYLHLDLLYPARRLWKRQIDQCNLGNVEDKVLNISRKDDIPGNLIPYVYFDYVRGIRCERMITVLSHNREDIISLARLLSEIASFVENPEYEKLQSDTCLLGLGLMFEKNKQFDRAIYCLEKALKITDDLELYNHISKWLTMCIRRSGCWEKGVIFWQCEIETKSVYKHEASIELAKYYEHKEKDHKKALELVTNVYKSIELKKEFSKEIYGQIDKDLDQLDQITKRLERLIAKINKV